MEQEVPTLTPTVEPSAPLNPWQMDIGDLAKAAGIDGSAPAQPQGPSEPTPQPQPSSEPASPYSFRYDASGVTLTIAAELGGETFRGKDLKEVTEKLAKSKIEGNAYIRHLKTGNNQPAAQPLQEQILQQELPPEDRQKISELLGKFLTPELKQHIANEGMAQVLGVPAEAVPQMVQGITKTVADYEANLLLMDFGQRCQGYLDTPENSTALHESLCTVLGGDPAENGYKPSVDDLEAAYALAVHRGKITPHDQQASQARQARPPVMPTTNSAGQGLAGGQNPWAMDINQLAALAGINNGN